MHASFDGILFEMDKYISKPATQIKCIKMLFPILKNQKSLEPLIQALNRINNALNELPDEVELQATCLSFFGDLINNPTLYSLLANTDISSLIAFILYCQRDDSEISKKALVQISKIIRLQKLTPFYSNSQFVENLVYLSRVHGKSYDHASTILEISKYLDGNIPEIKELLTSFLLFSRNFAKNENFQEILSDTFIKLMKPDFMQEIGPSTVSQFSEIAALYYQNQKILHNTFYILSTTKEQIPKSLMDIILKKQNVVLKDPENLPILIEIFTTKLTNKNTPPSLLIYAYETLEQYMTTLKFCKYGLHVCYNSLCSSLMQDKGICINLLSMMTSIITFYENNISIVKQAGVILHQLSKIPDVGDLMASAAVPLTLSSTLFNHSGDKKTVSILATVLDDACRKSKIAAGQLSRPERITSFKEILVDYKDDDVILKHILSILLEVALSNRDFAEFFELSEESKAPYYIDSSVCRSILKSHIDEIDVVKPVMLFAEPSQSNGKFVNSVMKRYNGDRDIQFCCLATGLFDVQNVATALSVCGEDAIRFVVPVLEDNEEPLSPQLLEFLLSCDRNDTTKIILKDLDNGNSKIVASLFELCFVNHLPIAKKLAEQNLWKPSEQDEPLIMTVLGHSIFDKQLFASALYFAKHYKVEENSLSSLLDGMRNYPKDKEIVLPCAKFISMLEPSNYIEHIFNDSRAVGIVSLSMNMFLQKDKPDEEVIFYLLKMIHIISFFESSQNQFVSSMSIPILVESSELSTRCANEANQIFSNIVDDDFISNQLYEHQAYKSAFVDFNESCYYFVATLLARSNFELNEDQFKRVYKHLSSVKTQQLTDNNAFCLMSIIESYVVRNSKVPRLDAKKFLTILTAFPTDKAIIEKVLHIIPRTKEFNLNEQLLFALFEILRLNIQEPTIIRETCVVLHYFSKVDVHKNIIQAQSTKELLINVLVSYYKDPAICSTLFTFLQGCEEAIFQILNAISYHTEKDVLLPISQCLLSISTTIDITTTILNKLIQCLKQSETNKDICANLMQTIFLSSEKEQCIPILLRNIHLLAETCVRHCSSLLIARSILGIINNIADQERNIPSLQIAGPIVSLCLKNFSNDSQVFTAAAYIIIKFSQKGKSSLFKHAIPSLLVAFRSQKGMPQKGNERTQLICDTICSLRSSISEFSEIVSDEMIKLFLKVTSERREEETDYVLRSILELTDSISLEKSLFSNCKTLFDIATNKETPEIVAARIFTLLGKVRDRHLIQRYDSFVPYLVQILKSGSKYSAPAAVQLLVVISTLRPDIVAPFADAIISEQQKTTNPDTQRAIAAIRERLK